MKPPPRAEHGRVDDAADRHIHLCHHRVLQGVERTGTTHVEDRERGEVEDAGVLAHREMLGVDDRRPPARIPLGSARLDAVLLDERRVGLVPLRPLPADRLVERGAERLLLRVHRRAPDAALARPLLRRVHDAVRLRERLERPRLHVRARLLVVVEAAGVGGVEVDVRLAVHHPLRDRLADAGAFLHPHGRRRPQALHLGELAEDRHAVGRQRDEPVDRVLHTDRLVADDLGHQVERVLHLIGEVRLRERELRRGERRLLDRRDLLRVVEDRAVGVGADLEADAVLALVHEHVHVAHDRELDRARRGLEPRHRADVDHLVHGRASAECARRPSSRAAGSTRRRRSRPPRPRSRHARCARAGCGRARRPSR